jgi:hypothetical protein
VLSLLALLVCIAGLALGLGDGVRSRGRARWSAALIAAGTLFASFELLRAPGAVSGWIAACCVSIAVVSRRSRLRAASHGD